MIRSIGMQRFMVILLLIGAAVAMGLFKYMVAIPQKVKTDSELRGIRGNISTLSTELENMQTNMHIFEARKLIFQEMQAKGFFSKQDRAEARDAVNAIQKLSKILSAKYEIRPAVIEEQKDAPEEFEYTVIKSDVTINLAAIDDTDIYRFIYFLNYGFPGQVTLKDLKIERVTPVNDVILKEIGGGQARAIIEASVDIEWRTMARKDEVDIAPEPEGRGDLQ